MNNGKVCVSICAKTIEELNENVKRAAKFADVIELRFDCLEKNKIRYVLEKILKSEKQFLVTFRPAEQGGKRELSLRERLKFWEFFFARNARRENFYADLEFDLQLYLKLESNKIIVSAHDFTGSTDNLPLTYEIFKITNGKIFKIAVQADDITDSIAIWKLLEKAKSENRQLIPIAMGEAGKWTRILGLAHGAPLVYASLDTGKETAAGQISAQDLIETYRVKELNEQTEIYGIVGNPVSHSLSPFMHNAAFEFHKLNAVYISFEVKNLDEFVSKFIREETREIELNLRGFSVTIPHKEAIIKHLDSIDETAKEIAAVNTVKIENGKLYGYNTDAEGFIEPLRNAYGSLKGAKVAVLGSGGAARACVYALRKEKAHVTIFARNVEKTKSLAAEFKVQSSKFKVRDESFADFDILVNATPLGTKGEMENETPAFASQIENVKLVYDLVYNPFETRFIKEAHKANVPSIGGLTMLAAQGAKQFEIWTGKEAPVKEMSGAERRKLS